MASFQTGSYVGNGTTQSIAGVAFAPAAVMIRGTTGGEGWIWRHRDMAAGKSCHLQQAFVVDNGITSLDAAGFSVGNGSSGVVANDLGVTYFYVCVQESSWIALGTYVGDGGASKTITTGWAPRFVWDVKINSTLGLFYRTDLHPANESDIRNSQNLSDATVSVDCITEFTATGFVVGLGLNALGVIHYWIAFKVDAVQTATAFYTGNGAADRSIVFMSDTPTVAWVAGQEATRYAWGRITGMADDLAGPVITGITPSGSRLERFNATGVVVTHAGGAGESPNVNTLGYYVMAFGPPDTGVIVTAITLVAHAEVIAALDFGSIFTYAITLAATVVAVPTLTIQRFLTYVIELAATALGIADLTIQPGAPGPSPEELDLGARHQLWRILGPIQTRGHGEKLGNNVSRWIDRMRGRRG